MTLRQFDFDTGVETSTVPTTGSDPVAAPDLVTLGYGQENFAKRYSWYDRQASVTTIRAVVSTPLQNGTVTLNYGTNQFWKYDTSSTATDDGSTVLKPDNLGGGDPGRWINITSGGGGGSAGADNFELFVDKLVTEHYQVFTKPIKNSVGNSFAQPLYRWVMKLLEDYASGTTMYTVVNPVYLDDADPDLDSITGWTQGGGATNLAITATGKKVGAQRFTYDKDNTTTFAYNEFQPVGKAIPNNNVIELWHKFSATANLSALRIQIAKETGFTNTASFDLTTDVDGTAITASAATRFFKPNLGTLAPTATTGTGWTVNDAIGGIRIGVVTSVNTQTYTDLGLDGVCFGDSTGLFAKQGMELTMYNNSTRDPMVIDAASTDYQGKITLAAGLANAYTAISTSAGGKAVRSLPTIELGKAVPQTGLSGTIANTQEVRIEEVWPASTAANSKSFARFDTSKILKVKAIASLNVDVYDDRNWSAQFTSGKTVVVFATTKGDGKECYAQRTGTTFTLTGNATHAAGVTTLPLSAVTGIVAGDQIILEQITMSTSLVGVTSNENFQATTSVEYEMNDVGLRYPGEGSLYSHHYVGGATVTEAALNRRGVGATLFENGSIPKNNAFSSRQLAAGPFTAANYWTLPSAEVALRSDNSGDFVSGSMRIYLTTAPTGDHAIIANYNTVSNGWWIGARGGSAGGIAFAGEGIVHGATPAVPVGQWFHFAFAARGETQAVNLWVNGASTTFTQGATNYDANNRVTIGASLIGNFMGIGYIADVMLWDNYTLTQADVNLLYNNGVHRKVGAYGDITMSAIKNGLSGQKASSKAVIARTTDADDLFLTAHGMLKVG